MTVRLQHLADNGRITLNNGMGKKKDYREDFFAKGLSIVGDYMGNAKTMFEAECLVFGHRVKVRADMPFGCNICSTVGEMPLSQLKNDPLGQVPCKAYLVQFEDGILKTGHSKYGAVVRGKGWPPFKLIKEIEDTLYHARRIEAKTRNQVKGLDLYKPLKHDGGTECFEEKQLKKLLNIFSKEEKLA